MKRTLYHALFDISGLRDEIAALPEDLRDARDNLLQRLAMLERQAELLMQALEVDDLTH
ncbi:MAG TPA: hypothetical protein VFN10_01285 [Thermoanaerobaculia bacterium]|nr:hypothetical protein [Thermoanaerobaculia bacterium]